MKTDNVISPMADTATKVVNTFLTEFCVVNNLSENELKNFVHMVIDTETVSIIHKQTNAPCLIIRKDGNECVPELLLDKEKYVKTDNFINNYKNEKENESL